MAVSRRQFLNVLLGGGILGWLGSVIYPVLSYLKPPITPEARFRRQGFGLATIFITMLVVALHLKIRQMEGR
jgi:hypothetical protein